MEVEAEIDYQNMLDARGIRYACSEIPPLLPPLVQKLTTWVLMTQRHMLSCSPSKTVSSKPIECFMKAYSYIKQRSDSTLDSYSFTSKKYTGVLAYRMSKEAIPLVGLVNEAGIELELYWYPEKGKVAFAATQYLQHHYKLWGYDFFPWP
jgi:hypothetical protein